MNAFIMAFGSLGYVAYQDNFDFEPGFEKIAIYSLNERPTHAAKQIISGRYKGKWSSKLGEHIDIAHDLMDVCGPIYGAPKIALRKPL